MKYIVSEAAKRADAELEAMDITEVFGSNSNQQEQQQPKENVIIVNKSFSKKPTSKVRVMASARPR